MTWPPEVRIVEVGPRDGLQNEANIPSTANKISFIESLANAGLQTIECGGFVSQRWIPQMADTTEVFSGVRRLPNVVYSALVPNLKGLEAALISNVNEIALFVAASETFSNKNINCTIDESLERAHAVTSKAKLSGLRVRGYISCVLGCPYEGAVLPAKVAEVANALIEMGCDEISLGDTIGVGTPAAVVGLLKAINIPVECLAVHFHNTYGQALTNVLAALDWGVSVVDASAGGLGGCPYAPGASGNLATEDLVYMLDGMGVSTGVDLNKVIEAARGICHALGRKPQSKLSAVR